MSEDLDLMREAAKQRTRAPQPHTSVRPEHTEDTKNSLVGRAVSSTGGMKGVKPARFGGADSGALRELAEVYGFGEQVYDRFNYLKGYPWSQSIDALFRHLFAFMGGEEFDPESGKRHTAHVAWHALTLTSFQQREIGTDDREPKPMFTPSKGLPGARVFHPIRDTTYEQEYIADLRKPWPAEDEHEPTCCDYACYEDPGCMCDGCNQLCQCDNCKALRRKDTTGE